MFYILFLLALLFTNITAFQAYDCHHPKSLGIYELKNEIECNDILGTSRLVGTKEATLVQMPGYYDIKGKLLTSSLKIDKVYCSYFFNRVMRIIPEAYVGFETIRLNRGDGLHLMQTGSISIANQVVNIGLNEETIIVDKTMVGSEGYCRTFGEKVDVNIYKIKLEEVDIRVKVNRQGKQTGISIYGDDLFEIDSKGYGYLGDGSLVTWDPAEIRVCPWEKVYSGYYEEFVTKGNNTVALFSEISASVIFAGKGSICGHKVQLTNSDRLFLLAGIHTTDADLNTLGFGSWKLLLLSTVSFVENLQVKILNNITRAISFNECKLNAKLMQEIVHEARASPEEIGFKLTGQPGTLAIVSGAALHLMVCPVIEVKLREVDTCYTEIPVTKTNLTLNTGLSNAFMDPVTRVISDSSSVIECNDVKNPYFNIRGQWYRLGPKLQVTPQPKKLPDSLTNLLEIDTTELKGLYPHELTDKMENFNEFHSRKHLVINKLLNTVQKVGYDKVRNTEWHIVGFNIHIHLLLLYITAGIYFLWNLFLTYKLFKGPHSLGNNVSVEVKNSYDTRQEDRTLAE